MNRLIFTLNEIIIKLNFGFNLFGYKIVGGLNVKNSIVSKN